MTKTEKERVKKVKDLLKYILTVDDKDITLATIEAVIELLDDIC